MNFQLIIFILKLPVKNLASVKVVLGITFHNTFHRWLRSHYYDGVTIDRQGEEKITEEQMPLSTETQSHLTCSRLVRSQ